MMITKGIAVARQLAETTSGINSSAIQANIVGAVFGKLRRKSVGCKQRGNRRAGPSASHVRMTCSMRILSCAVEAIAGFGLDGGGSGAKHPVAMLACGGEQFVNAWPHAVAATVRRIPAACSGDLLIGSIRRCAVRTRRGAIAGEDQMRVCVDESRSPRISPRHLSHCVGAGFRAGIRSTEQRPQHGPSSITSPARPARSWPSSGISSADARRGGPCQRNELPDVDDHGGHSRLWRG